MAADEIHELSAAYALNALGDEDARAFEEHLATCPRCRDEVRSFEETASALAYASEPVTPRAGARAALLERARAERSNVVPFRQRHVRLLAASTAVAAAAAVAMSIWAYALSQRVDRLERATRSTRPAVAAPLAAHGRAAGAEGAVVVSSAGEASIVLFGLPAAPAGRVYEAWVLMADGTNPAPAGIFDAAKREVVVSLKRRLPKGARVAVTVEPRGGSGRPTTPPVLTSANV